jgi:hypothetical protein
MGIREAITRRQGSLARQLQQHVSTTGRATTSTQHRALIRTQRQLHDSEGGVRQWLFRQEAVVQHDQTNIQGFR